MSGNRKYRRLPLVAVFFLLFISFPILTAVNKQHMVFGIPVLFFYIFLLWLFVIVLTFISFRKS